MAHSPSKADDAGDGGSKAEIDNAGDGGSMAKVDNARDGGDSCFMFACVNLPESLLEFGINVSEDVPAPDHAGYPWDEWGDDWDEEGLVCLMYA